MFYFKNINEKKILVSDLLDEKSALHFFTTRASVVTPRDLPELNGISEDNLDNISRFLGIPKENIISPVQTHSSNIAVAKPKTEFPDTDALIVDRNDIAIMLNFADCTPIIVYDEKNNIGAVVHGGWRGTACNIVTKTISFMKEQYGTSADNVIAIIGPAISIKNYQVDTPVFEQIKMSLNSEYDDYYFYDSDSKKYNIDLKTVNKHQLEELGIKRIDMCEYCTYDSVDVFFSYRKENAKTARHSAVLKLVK